MKYTASWLKATLLAVAIAATAAQAAWIFADSFEGEALIEGENGNLWDQMHWDNGTWQ